MNAEGLLRNRPGRAHAVPEGYTVSADDWMKIAVAFGLAERKNGPAEAGPGGQDHTISARIFFLSSLPTEVRGSSSTNTTRSGMP